MPFLWNIGYYILYSLDSETNATYMALVCMLDKLHTAMEEGDYAIGIFIDFRNAFDTVDHRILLYQVNWKNHLDHICTKIAKVLVWFWKPGTFLKNTPYCLCIIRFYTLIWHTVFKYGELHIKVIRVNWWYYSKKIVRIIHGVPPRTHTEPLFLVLDVLKVSNLYKYNIALFMYKLKSSMLPDIFLMFIRNCEIHNYETGQLNNFIFQCATIT